MRNISMMALLILAGTGMSAQNEKGTHPTSLTRQTESSCPVGFGANLSGRAVARPADDAKKDSSAQLLELSFVPLDTPAVKNAGIIVHGLSKKGRLLPVQNSTADDALQIFQLRSSTDSTSLDQAHVWITKVTAAHWVEITDIEYMDGSSWHASKTSLCHAKLSGFKLVDVTVQ